MEAPPLRATGPSPEQLRYAKVLETGMYIGLLLLLITFVVYVSGILEPYVPPDELAGYWTMSAHEYTEAAQVETGWGWVQLTGHGDFLNFIPIAMLAGVSILCYLSIVPILARNRDWIYLVLCVLEVLVLTLAASGIIASGH